ncbi:MAG: 1-phosphofructokinase family hexose kinase [Synergistaceae bacterium]|jgi:1-phosphofructokinase|nr:1-phosphofructokinase family hexose kinase [Synergistaceae bacterium]
MIVTVTLNPTLDKTADVDRLKPGGLNRLENITFDAGGKGVNVSKVIRALGGESVATGFLGGSSGREIERMLESMGIETDFVKIEGNTRSNLKVIDGESAMTELNDPGAPVAERDLALMREKLEKYAASGVTFVFAGKLPPGADANTYAGMIETVKARGAKAFLDADGEPFRRALNSAAAVPDFLKPNISELTECLALKEDPDVPRVAALCAGLIREKGIGKIAVSMGSDGAVFVDASGAFRAPGLRVKAHSAAGAGDSMAAAFALCEERGAPFEEAARLSMAASAGAVTTKGTKAPSFELVSELLASVRLEKI